MASKILAVFGPEGVGKRMIVGSLIYKSGLGLQQLEQLEEGTDRKVASIVPFYEENGITKAFYAPSCQMVVEDTTTPNIAFWVVDASHPDGGASSKAELESLISAGSLKPTEKLIILFNKMDRIEWSEPAFRKMAVLFQQAVHPDPSVQVKVLPLAALRGENIMEPPSGVSWTEDTLMQALA